MHLRVSVVELIIFFIARSETMTEYFRAVCGTSNFLIHCLSVFVSLTFLFIHLSCLTILRSLYTSPSEQILCA